ncbi:gelsolin-like protein 2 [Octopus bimaculoides]|uniref:gelsolin-like protein 2 n=1 Tax=Octopus bimaculoides TaxID=37653 RepID=UPI0022DF801A|nr:gelsolin-like protein 2 [Octopus bimaculoides]
MSGLRKTKKYDWKDSNMALVGSDLDKSVKKDAASKEPMWHGTGEGPCLKVWRIEKFQVKDWPEKDYGKFYRGDSYIILKSYLEENKLLHDIHFWIGAESSQDEYGTAAYKTVELDAYLDDIPVQHRECDKHESELFKSYFSKFEVLKGGVASGFNPVKPDEYKSRLLFYTESGKKVSVKEVSFRKQLNQEDIFLLDMGIKVFQWYGDESNLFQRHRANYYCQQLKNDRGGKTTSEVINQDMDDGNTFQKLINQCIEKQQADGDDDDDDDDDDDEDDDDVNRLYRCLFVFILFVQDAFLIDTRTNCFVWIGKKASKKEKANGLSYAHNYLKDSKHPLVPVTCLSEGSESKCFHAVFQG